MTPRSAVYDVNEQKLDPVLLEVLHYGVPLAINDRSPARLPFSTEVLEEANRRRSVAPDTPESLFEEARIIWRNACRRAAESATHPLCLPLSAGLDSRAVLAGLRDAGVVPATVTYGVPGAFDYELAPAVAARAGAPHLRLDLGEVTITRELLVRYAKRLAKPGSLLDMSFNGELMTRTEKRYSYINGFAGDALTGKHLANVKSQTWAQACADFSRWCCASKTETLTPRQFNPTAGLPDSPLVDTSLLSAGYQLDFSVRQARMIRPIVMPTTDEVFTPFTDPDWCAFILGLPNEFLADQRFIIAFLRSTYTDLFSLPTTANGGLTLDASAGQVARHKKRLRRRGRWRRRLRRWWPTINVPPADRQWQYLDFRNQLRQNTPIAAMVDESMQRLDELGATPWLSAKDLLAAHRSSHADHAKALNALLNLEILLSERPDLFLKH